MEENLNINSIEGSCENYICSICLREDIKEEEISETNCSHSFCNVCLEDWLNKGKNSCPLCRNDIKTFITNGKETRIFPVLIQQVSAPMINNIPVTTIIQNLVNSNVRLKCSLYLTLAVLAITGNYYINNWYTYSDLLLKYKECNTNLTNCLVSEDYQELVSAPMYDNSFGVFKIFLKIKYISYICSSP